MTPIPVIPHGTNVQEKEHAAYREDGVLDVVQVWRTLQGEGPFVGTPAVFARLAGCNLQCPWCDTDYTTGRQQVAPEYLVREIRDLSLVSMKQASSLVVFTGGEPFRQNLGPAARLLLSYGYRIQVETNGTLYHDDFPWVGEVSIVCSPKTPRIAEEIKRYVTAFKYIVDSDHLDTDGLPLSTLDNPCGVYKPAKGFPRDRIFIQPADTGDRHKNELNTKVAVQICMNYGYRLSLQTHKLLGLQ